MSWKQKKWELDIAEYVRMQEWVNKYKDNARPGAKAMVAYVLQRQKAILTNYPGKESLFN